jgi:prepilin-type processing-associated H-X9-DG protein
MIEHGAPGWSRSVTPRSVRRRVLKVLVGVAGIGIFGALLFPYFATPHTGHGRSVALSNIKQVGLGLLMYANDFDDILPVDGWMDRTKVYAYNHNEAIFHAVDLKDPSPDQCGIAFRARLRGQNLDNDKRPEATAMVFDSILLERNATSGLWSLPDPPRHRRTNSVGFADGHARMLTIFQEQDLR